MRNNNLVKLGDIKHIDMVMGQSPPGSTYNENREGMPFLQGNAEFGSIYPKERKYTSNPMRIAKKGSILVSVRAPVGDVNIADKDYCIGRGLCSLELKKGNNIFFFYLFQSLKKKLQSLSIGSTFKAITKGQLSNFEISLPPITEQKRISGILSSMDEVIGKVEKEIGKTEKLKRGLMKDLLTGRRRLKVEVMAKAEDSSRVRFKKTDIGEIPEDWNLKENTQVCTKITDGTHDTPSPSKDGYFLITSKHIKKGKIDFSESYKISKEDFEVVNKRSKVDPGDILFSMIGTIGDTVVIDYEYPEFAIKNVGLFKTGGDFLLAKWIHYFLQSEYAKRYIQKNTKGSTQKYLPLFTLRKLPIIITTISERKRIVDVLSGVDGRIELLREKKRKLERIKKGLMNDLLSGKKRIKASPQPILES